MTIDDTLAYLVGTWALSRTIEDYHRGATYAFRGSAEVRRRGCHARYEEEGVLRVGERQGRARRALRLTATEEGVVVVCFPDGRPFFDLNLGSGVCSVLHPCRMDCYELAFQVASESLLVERWHVTGPSKHYAAETVWQRQ